MSGGCIFLKPMRGTLWGGGSPTPTEEDVQQGQLNNCYLCCALTVVASIEHGPAAIRRCFPGCCFPGKKQQQQQQQGNGSRSNLPSRFAVRLHGGAAFERCMAEFQKAAAALTFPPASREKVANVLIAREGEVKLADLKPQP